MLTLPGIRFGIAVVLSGGLLVVAAPATAARIWKWVDEHGTTHYSQSKPPPGHAGEILHEQRRPSGIEGSGECSSLSCRAARLESERRAREQAAQAQRDDAARAAAAHRVYPTPVEETDDESRRGSRCDSDAEKRRMLLQNVELTHAERRALRGFSPAVQRRFLLERIPEQYRNIE
jgi:hypothetical protein